MTFMAKFCREAENRGMRITNRNPVMVSSADNPRGSIDNWLTNCHEQLEDNQNMNGQPQLIFVVKMDDNTEEYHEIKRSTHALLGIPSQCITAAVLRRVNIQVLANLCMKVNAKLGGINSVFPDRTLPLVHEAPTILIGADVCYPKMEKSGRPPVSAVAASLDRHSFKYAARLAVNSGLNDVSHLPQMLWELFVEHYKHTRLRPKHVIYFRSGISASRVEDVVNAEVRALRKAFRMLAPDYEPSVTFIIANKHHHVRLFVPNRAGRDESDRSGNPVAGTIVDTVVDPQRLEFFLLSHAGIQGTSVPTQYKVVVDENNLSVDQVEKLIYRLGYSCARCTRSIAIVPPIEYAQLAAEQALGSITDTASECSSTVSTRGSTYTLAGLSDRLAGAMYFV